MFAVIKMFIRLLVIFALVAGCERGAFHEIRREPAHIVNPALETQIALLDGNWEQVISYGNRWSETEKNNIIPHLLVGFAYYMKGKYELQLV